MIWKKYCFSATRFTVEYSKSVSPTKPALNRKLVSGTISDNVSRADNKDSTIATPYDVFNPLPALG